MVKNEIIEAMTHGGSSIIAIGSTRPAMMYLYTMRDIGSGTRHSSVAHVETRTATNNQSLVNRIKCPIAKSQGSCKPKQEGPHHRAAT